MSVPFQPDPGANYFTTILPFSGCGGGGFGLKNAKASFRGVHGRFQILGGFDKWDYAAGAFEYLVDAPCAVVNASTMTAADLIRLYGPKPPKVTFTSPPCVAATKLVTNAKAAEPDYVAMNYLLLTNTRTMFEAWPEGSDFVLCENVPNVLAAQRGADMVREWCALMRSKGYAIHVGTHNARHIGNLGQNRDRLLIIARHQERVPVFLYKPPHRDGLTLGDVVGPLPLPDDESGGPMHGMTDGMSFRNRLRLWKIEAGKDWRSLINDGLPERARFRRHLVANPKEPCATIGGPGSNGPCAVADEQAPGRIGIELAPSKDKFPGAYGVQATTEAAAAVRGEAAPSNGPNALADDRAPAQLGIDLGLPPATRHHVDRVTAWDQATGCVTCSPAPSSGCPAGADPRVPAVELRPPSTKGPGKYDVFSKLGINPWGKPTRAVIGGEGSGACACGDPRVDLLMKIDPRAPANHYQVCDPAKPTPPVLCATRPGGGALCIADGRAPVVLLAPGTAWNHGVLGVLRTEEPSGCVTGEGRPACGRFALAGKVPAMLAVEDSDTRHRHVLGVQDPARAACCVTGEAKITSGAFAAACRVPVDLGFGAHNPRRHENKFAIIPFKRPARTVCGGDTRVGSGAPACADPRVVDLTLSPRGRWHDGAGPGRWGVKGNGDVCCTITADARQSKGPFSFADGRHIPVQLLPKKKCYDKGYGVLGDEDIAHTIAGCSWVGCGPYAMAGKIPEAPYCCAPRGHAALVLEGGGLRCDGAPAPTPITLHLNCSPHAGAYGVATFCAPSRCVIGHAKIDNSTSAVADPRPAPKYIVLTYEQTEAIVEGYVTVPFAIVDPADPTRPLAIVDNLDKPAYRLEEVPPKGNSKRKRKIKTRRMPVPVWMISRDGTCHRELTTLELAALQGFPVRHKGRPLDFGGGSNKQRKVVGNAVPPPVAQAIGEQILISLIASTMCSFMLTPGDWDVWVKGLIDEGFTVVPSDKVFDFANGMLDDGAPRPATTKGARKLGRARRALVQILADGGSDPAQALPAS